MNFGLLPGFDVGELSEDGPDDFEGLDASAAHIANLLSTEPADGKSCICLHHSVCITFSELHNFKFDIFHMKKIIIRKKAYRSFTLQLLHLDKNVD